jgi:hypothetical protein
LNTGTQYFPVDSMQTSRQLLSKSQALNARIWLLEWYDKSAVLKRKEM